MINLVNWQQEEPTDCGGERQLSVDGTSRVSREAQARICERLGVRFPGATRPASRDVATSLLIRASFGPNHRARTQLLPILANAEEQAASLQLEHLSQEFADSDLRLGRCSFVVSKMGAKFHARILHSERCLRCCINQNAFVVLGDSAVASCLPSRGSDLAGCQTIEVMVRAFVRGELNVAARLCETVNEFAARAR